MPVVTRKRSVRILLVVAAGFPLLLAGAAALLSVVFGQSCSGSGVGDAPSALAIRDIPASFLRIYEQVGAQFKIPWEVLAGIGKEECDQGRKPDPSCTPQPGARGPGVANFAGVRADADRCRRGRRQVRSAEAIPARSVARAARPDDGCRARGALADPAGRANRPADRRVRRLGPRLQPRTGRVRRPRAGRRARLPGRRDRGVRGCLQRGAGHAARARDGAKILPSGDAAAPADAPVVVQEMIAAGNRIDHFAYSYGGAHGDPAQTMNQTPTPRLSRAPRRTAARATTAPRPPPTCCRAAGSGRACWRRRPCLGELESVGTRALGSG